MFKKKSVVILIVSVLIVCFIGGVVLFVNKNNDKSQELYTSTLQSQDEETSPSSNGKPDDESYPDSTSDTIPPPNDTPDEKNEAEPSYDDEKSTPKPLRVITVNNAQELVSQIASNTHIKLMPGSYDFNSFDEKFYTFYYNYRGLRNLENVVIEGIGEEQIDFLTGSAYSDVLHISNSKKITLKNLNLGHKPPVKSGYCEGGVISLSECDGITIDNCTMFGCGTIGIYAYNVSNLVCTNSTIKDCTEDLVYLVTAEGVLFQDCTFISRDFEEIIL